MGMNNIALSLDGVEEYSNPFLGMKKNIVIAGKATQKNYWSPTVTPRESSLGVLVIPSSTNDSLHQLIQDVDSSLTQPPTTSLDSLND